MQYEVTASDDRSICMAFIWKREEIQSLTPVTAQKSVGFIVMPSNGKLDKHMQTDNITIENYLVSE